MFLGIQIGYLPTYFAYRRRKPSAIVSFPKQTMENAPPERLTMVAFAKRSFVQPLSGWTSDIYVRERQYFKKNDATIHHCWEKKLWKHIFSRCWWGTMTQQKTVLRLKRQQSTAQIWLHINADVQRWSYVAVVYENSQERLLSHCFSSWYLHWYWLN